MYLQLVITITSAFIIMMIVDKVICSKWFNARYVKKCVKKLKQLPAEQRERVQEWLGDHIVPALDSELSAKEIIANIPLEHRHRIKEKHIIAMMSLLKYQYLSDCFLDPPCFAVKLKD